MTLTAKDVDEIMKLLEVSSFDSLSLEMDGVKLSLRRGAAAVTQERTRVFTPAPAAQEQATQPARHRATPPSEPGLVDAVSPLLGIFYRAPKPGEPPFVEVGSKVEPDTVIGIVEVMKLMNTVRAGAKGEVVEIPGVNGALVEYGEVLLRVRPK